MTVDETLRLIDALRERGAVQVRVGDVQAVFATPTPARAEGEATKLQHRAPLTYDEQLKGALGILKRRTA